MRRRAMSAKQVAKHLHENCLYTYDEACRIAGYSPHDEYRRETIGVLLAILGVTGALVIASMLPMISGVTK